jgi:hypothetical protein
VRRFDNGDLYNDRFVAYMELVGVHGRMIVVHSNRTIPGRACSLRRGMKLGSALKAARKAADLSRSEAARRARIDPAMLFRIENAPNASPTFATVSRPAVVLDLDLNTLPQ